MLVSHTHSNNGRIIKNNKNANPWFGAIPFSIVKKSGSFFSLSSSTLSSDLKHIESWVILSLESEKMYTEKKNLFKLERTSQTRTTEKKEEHNEAPLNPST